MADLFVCVCSGDAAVDDTAYAQKDRMGSMVRWGPRETAMEQTEAWWRENVDEHALGYCKLVPVDPPSAPPPPEEQQPYEKVSAYDRLRRPAY